MNTKEEKAIVKKEEKPNLRSIMTREDVRSRFVEVLGENNANGYISSVLIAVAGSDDLQKCSANSIIKSALRAANMRLSVDPATPQAYLVPYNIRTKDGTYVKNATMIVGYHGLYQMAIRTGHYRYLNVADVYEGDKLTENPLTGIHSLERFNIPLHIGKDQPKPENKEIVGYLLYFQLIDGFEKTFYMTNEQCDDHGREYAPGYNSKNSLWKTNPQIMYWKTVLRLGLMKWGYLDPMDRANLESNDEVFDSSEPIIGDFIEGGVFVGDEQPFMAINDDMSQEEKTKMLGFDQDKPRPFSPEGLKKFIDINAKKFDGDKVGEKKRNYLAGIIDLCFAHNGAEMDRHELCQFLTGEPSTKKIADAYILALWDWLDPQENEDGIFSPSAMATREAISALRFSRKQNGQQELFVAQEGE
jgi:recombination protein RecT